MSSDVVRLTVALPRAEIDKIERPAAKQGKTKTQILREGILLKVFLEDERESGARFFVRRWRGFRGFSCAELMF